MGAPHSVPRRLISLGDYHKMGDAGVFHPTDRVELIEGELIQMAPIGGAHIQLVNILTRLLVTRVGEEGVVSTQNPISLPPDSEPEPDIAILRPECLHRKEVPSAKDVLLVIEVSVTTLEYDRDVKTPLYAVHGIPEVWIFDPTTLAVFIYREPTRSGYRRLLTPLVEEAISPQLLPDVRLLLRDVWQ